MLTMTATTGTVHKVARLRNTVNGNPRYRITVDVDSSFTVTGVTEHDAMFVYGIVWDSLEGKRVRFDYSVPRTNVIITRVEVI